jgi:hypothetical protein
VTATATQSPARDTTPTPVSGLPVTGFPDYAGLAVVLGLVTVLVASGLLEAKRRA